MNYLPLCIAILALAGCDRANLPSLECTLSSSQAGSPDQSQRHFTMSGEARLSGVTDGVWDFHGQMTETGTENQPKSAKGMFYRYPDGSFDLVASTENERITIMPSNPTLKDRGIQGVIMIDSQTVANGKPITGNCELFGPMEA